MTFVIKKADKFRKILAEIARRLGLANDDLLELRAGDELIKAFLSPTLLPNAIKQKLATFVFGL